MISVVFELGVVAFELLDLFLIEFLALIFFRAPATFRRELVDFPIDTFDFL